MVPVSAVYSFWQGSWQTALGLGWGWCGGGTYQVHAVRLGGDLALVDHEVDDVGVDLGRCDRRIVPDSEHAPVAGRVDGNAHLQALERHVADGHDVAEVVAAGSRLVDIGNLESIGAHRLVGGAAGGAECVDAGAPFLLQRDAVAQIRVFPEHPQVAAPRVDVQRGSLGRRADLDLGEIRILLVDERAGVCGTAAEAVGSWSWERRLCDADGHHALRCCCGGQGQQADAQPHLRRAPLVGGW